MTTATEFLADTETTSAEVEQERAVPSAPVVRPKLVWPGSDLLLIGLVLALAVAGAFTVVRRAQHERARGQFAAELTAAASCFQAFIHEQGSAPAGANAGVVPEGMASFLTTVNWTAPTSGGGSFRWINLPADGPEDPAHATGMITVTAFPPSPPLTLSLADLLEIDRRIDDGNLTTGKFRLGFNGWPVLRVGPSD